MEKRSILLGLLALSLVGCTSDEPKEVVAAPPPEKPQIQAKIDFKQAAHYNVQLAIGYLKQGQISRAKSKINRAMRLDPYSSEVHYAQAYIFERIKEFGEADRAYQQAIALNPTGGVEHNNYGAFLCRLGRYDEAEREFLTAVQDAEYTGSAEAYENAGICMQKAKHPRRARQYFQKALRHDHNREHALIEMAAYSVEDNKYEVARDYLMHHQEIAQPSARSLLLAIKIEKHFGNDDSVASHELLLKNQFSKTKEYKNYIQSAG